ncbi:oxidoreductase-like protein [Chaetomium sp. MPI-CAGE-AT-0009]|nr:oxidoreductase-like protein [Chaetomium sp. MPI-CAGE-AT-0009]
MRRKGLLGFGRLIEGVLASRNDRGPQYVIEAINKEMGKRVHTVLVPMCGYNLLVSRDPKVIKTVLATKAADWDVSEYRTASWEPMLGKGIFTSRGEDWKHSRALVRPQFAMDQINDLDLYERHVQAFFAAIDKHHSGSGDGQWTQAFDLQPLFYNLSLDVMSEMLYGYSVHSQDPSERVELPELPGYDPPDRENIGMHMDAGKAWIELRGAFWKYRWLLPVKQFNKHCAAIHKYAEWFVQLRLTRGDKYLSGLQQQTGETNGDRYVLLNELAKATQDPVELRSQTLNVLSAGRDTTAALLGWIVYFLARHPRVWSRLRYEVLVHFGPYVSGQPSGIEFRKVRDSLPYMNAVINETLRMAPVVPLNDRISLRDTILPRGGGDDRLHPVFVPKGTQILIPTYALGQRPELWDWDADKFRPERWIENGKRKFGFEFVPFGGGVRQCLGQQLARIKTAYVIIRLMQRYDCVENAESPPGARIRFHHTIENRSGSGVQTLKGHKLLMISPWEAPPGFLEKLAAAFPDLQIVYHAQPWATPPLPPVTLPAGAWDDVTVLMTFSTLPLPEEAPKLEYVQLMSAGVNHVFGEPMFKDTKVPFCSANGVHGPQISEWIISTYLAFEHRLPTYLDRQKAAHWDNSGLLDIEDSANKTIGILGYGSIGRQTARVAHALGMSVHAYTLHPRPTPASRRDRAWAPPGLGDPDGTLPTQWFSGADTADLHAFLASGLDLLVVAAPLTGKTRHLLGREEFAVLGRAGRGRTFGLVEALEGGLVRGAALDVTDPEPLPDGHVLWGARNVIVTPHVSGASTRYFERVLAILEVNLGRLGRGEELVNLVDRERGY